MIGEESDGLPLLKKSSKSRDSRLGVFSYAFVMSERKTDYGWATMTFSKQGLPREAETLL